MSIAIATMGKFTGAVGSSSDSGGGGGGGGVEFIEKKKPVVLVTKVRYDKKNKKSINISVKEKEETYNDEYKS